MFVFLQSRLFSMDLSNSEYPNKLEKFNNQSLSVPAVLRCWEREDK